MPAGDAAAAEHVDVLIVGAGLSGIGAAVRLSRRHPQRSLAILEMRDAIGGTWDLFRYPGVRSDSDMHTLGYPFRPWHGTKALADGPSILQYVVDTARGYGVDRLVRFGHRVTSVSWSSSDARWTVRAQVGPGQSETVTLTCSFLHLNAGYYRYDTGHVPDLPGREDFAGRVVHPQFWPEDLDCTGLRVVVLGSGATAVTLVPALAATAAQVTMLQRSPTWVMSLPGDDPVAAFALQRLPGRVGYRLVRWRNILAAQFFYELSRRRPATARRLLLKGVSAMLPAGYDVGTHFTPRYDPWDERLCFVPDGDLFAAIRGGRARVVTDTVDTLVPQGVRTSSGQVLPADVLVTATGLALVPVGGIGIEVDGVPVDVADAVVYKGMMLSGVPNLAFTIGYANASWTLKADLVAEYVCRLLTFMDDRGYRTVTPLAPPTPGREPLLPLRSGYVRRSLDLLPKQGDRAPWKVRQNYPVDRRMYRGGRVDDEGVRFGR